MSVTEVGSIYGITSNSIYRWLCAGVVDGDRNLILEKNRLKKELEIAYRILGNPLTADTQRSKD